MTLYIIGLGLSDEKDITLKGLEIIKRSTKVYLEGYTSIMNCSKADLETLYGREVIMASREMVEKGGDDLVAEAEQSDVVLLVAGDPISATTHLDLFLRAKKKGVEVEMVHNASILTAVGIVGLQLYKYGRTASIVFPQDDWDVQTHYDVVKSNKKAGLHTLCLLDIKTAEPSREELKKERPAGTEEAQFMTVQEGVKNLLSIEAKRGESVFTDKTLCVGCARLGSQDMMIKAGTAKALLDENFGGPLHCLIVPGELHFMEEEALELWKQ